MDKYLYFQDANNDAYMYPLDRLIGIIHDADTTLKMRFLSAVTGSTEDTAGGAVDLVTLTITTQKEKDVCAAIVAKINAHPNGDPFIVIADAVNSVYAHGDITGVAATFDS
jgi:hypothetical protein